MAEIIHAASVALIRDGEVLLIRRARPPFRAHWTLPGGRLEPGETAEACARRELMEEMGVAVSDLRQVLTMMVAADLPRRLSVFATASFEGAIAPSDEIDAWRWTKPAGLAALRTTPRLGEVVERAMALVGQG